ncbi:hypothetical protein V6N11_082318 [Hibiscus sabdariffa]|uniref:Uncharacterized protein n=1 Tax=Hibiscus sabdariffa TaxID=183260 RepID=A0ABR2PC68_9ROSI
MILQLHLRPIHEGIGFLDESVSSYHIRRCLGHELEVVVGSALAGFEIPIVLAVGDSGCYSGSSMRNLDGSSMLGYMHFTWYFCYSSQHSSLIQFAAHTPKRHGCCHNVHRRHQEPWARIVSEESSWAGPRLVVPLREVGCWIHARNDQPGRIRKQQYRSSEELY